MGGLGGRDAINIFLNWFQKGKSLFSIQIEEVSEGYSQLCRASNSMGQGSGSSATSSSPVTRSIVSMAPCEWVVKYLLKCKTIRCTFVHLWLVCGCHVPKSSSSLADM